MLMMNLRALMGSSPRALRSLSLPMLYYCTTLLLELSAESATFKFATTDAQVNYLPTHLALGGEHLKYARSTMMAISSLVLLLSFLLAYI